MSAEKKSQSNHKSRLLKVEKYDLEKKAIYGTLTNGEKAQVSIDKAAFERGVKKEPKQSRFYLGHRIDEKMQRDIPADGQHFVILEDSVILKKVEDGTRLMKANRVWTAGTDMSKLLEGYISFKLDKNREKIQRLQVWKDQAFLINDENKTFKMKANLDASYKLHLEESKNVLRLPFVGFQFRSIRPNENTDGLYKGTIVDVSICYEYKVITENEKVIKRQLESVDFDKHLQRYQEYAVQKYGTEVVIEATKYTSYPISTFSTDLGISDPDNDYGDFLNLRNATAVNFTCAESTKEIIGGNFGGWGVVRLAKDVKENGILKEKRFYIDRVYTKGSAKNFIQQKIKRQNGDLVELSDELKGATLEWIKKENEEESTAQSWEDETPNI